MKNKLFLNKIYSLFLLGIFVLSMVPMQAFAAMPQARREGNDLEERLGTDYYIDFYIYSKPNWLGRNIYWNDDDLAMPSFGESSTGTSMTVMFEDWTDNDFNDVQFTIRPSDKEIIVTKDKVDTASPNPTHIVLAFDEEKTVEIVETGETFTGTQLDIILWNRVYENLEDDTRTLKFYEDRQVCDVRDVLTVGHTQTYDVNGNEYQITPHVSEENPQLVKFRVKNENSDFQTLTSWISLGNFQVLPDNSELGPIALSSGPSETLDAASNRDVFVEFCLKNVPEVTVEATKADLIVTSIRLEPQGPTDREWVYVLVDVENIGETNTDSFRVGLYQYTGEMDLIRMMSLMNEDAQHRWFSNSISLSTGETETVRFGPFSFDSGRTTLMADADVDEIIDESNEENNQKYTRFYISEFVEEEEEKPEEVRELVELVHPVDVSISPNSKRVKSGDVADYVITLKDNHPIFNDNDPVQACANGFNFPCSAKLKSYTYDLQVSGLPFETKYPSRVTVGAGLSTQVHVKVNTGNRLIYPVNTGSPTETSAVDRTADIVPAGRDLVKFCFNGRISGTQDVICDVDDSLEEGDEATYVIKGQKYQITALWVIPSENKVRFKVNGEITDVLKINEIETLSDGSTIKALLLSSNEQETSVAISPGQSMPGAGGFGVAVSTDNAEVSAESLSSEGAVTISSARNIIEMVELCITKEGMKDCLVKDTIQEGDVTTYPIGGDEYDVQLLAVYQRTDGSYIAKLRINDEILNEMREGEKAAYKDFILKIYSIIGPEDSESPEDSGSDAAPTSDSQQTTSVSLKPISPSPTRTSRYSISIKATERLSGRSDSDSATLFVTPNWIPIPTPVPTLHKVKIELEKGWNLVSLPGRLGAFLPGECSNNKKLLGFVYLKDKNEYVTLQEAKKILGSDFNDYISENAFWIYAYEQCELVATVSKDISVEDLTLKAKWNLLPVAKDMIGKRLSEIGNGCNILSFYKWDGENQKWAEKDGNYLFTNDDIGRGFLVKVADDCKLTGYEIHPPEMPE